MLSTHLIDEMDRLLERVIVIDQGRIVRHEDVDAMRGSAFQVAGKASEVDGFLAGLPVLSRRRVGGLATAVVNTAMTAEHRAEAGGLELAPVSLQDLVAAYGLGDTAANDEAGSRMERSAA